MWWYLIITLIWASFKLMILETYRVLISLLHILFCKISLYIFCPYSIWTCLIYVRFSLENSLHALDMVPIVTVVVCKYFLPLDILSFNPLNRVFHRVKLGFDEVLLVNYFTLFIVLLVSCLRTLLQALDPQAFLLF